MLRPLFAAVLMPASVLAQGSFPTCSSLLTGGPVSQRSAAYCGHRGGLSPASGRRFNSTRGITPWFKHSSVERLTPPAQGALAHLPTPTTYARQRHVRALRTSTFELMDGVFHFESIEAFIDGMTIGSSTRHAVALLPQEGRDGFVKDVTTMLEPYLVGGELVYPMRTHILLARP